jgi:hypothetical protein
VIAKVTSGGGFRGVLNYLMNQKEQQKELEKNREKTLEKSAERTPETTLEMRRTEATEAHEKRAERELNGEQKGTGKSSAERELSERERAGLGERAERHRVIGGNMSGETPRELAREFGVFREQRPEIEKPVHHASLSAAKGERLTVEQWNEIAEKYVEKMGFGNSPYVVIQHTDTEHDHIHIVTSRIDLDGKVVSDFQSKMRAEAVMREVEREYSLQRVTPSRETERAALTRGEVERFNRTGELSAKMTLQERVDLAMKDAPSVTEFVERMNRTGVEVIPNLQSTGRVSGISFRINDELMKGSDLGKGYSWNGLQKRGLEYELERDNPALEMARERAEMSRDGERITAPQAPERSLTGSAGRDLFDVSNPVRTLEIDASMNPQQGLNVTDQGNIAREFSAREIGQQSDLERLNQLIEREPMNDRESLDRLNYIAGVEPEHDGKDALDRLNRTAGVEPGHDPERSQEMVLGRELNEPELSLALEQTATREVEERVIEIGFELSL